MLAGGISALSLQRPAAFGILIDDRAQTLGTIHVSAGERGADLALRPAELIAATNARPIRLA
jgi:prolyl-tRNA editing enzyme YbaK/EbsC (Cys-tRNA(Pro) deacylase)